MSIRFLLAGHAGCYNRGCEAIVRTTSMLLRSSFNNQTTILSSFSPEEDRAVPLGRDIKVVAAKLARVWEPWSPPWLLRRVCRKFAGEKADDLQYWPLLRALRQSDVVISVGGDNFTMDYGYPRFFMDINRLAKEKRKKLIIWAASIGPFPAEHVSAIAKNLQLADLITVREPASMEYLSRIGVTARIRRVADPAFLLPQEETPFEGVCPQDGAGIVGMNVSPLLGEYLGGEGRSRVVAETVVFLRRLMKETPFPVLLVPHVLMSLAHNNDHCFMKEIFERLKDTGRVSLLPPGYNAPQLKYIIARCRFFIGARTHATIAALSSGVPAVSIGYSPKARGINEDIFGHHRFILAAKDFSAAALARVFRRVLGEEAGIRKTLAERIPAMKDLARANVGFLREVL